MMSLGLFMELIRGIYNIQAQHRDCVLTIGNFDGVHLGHHCVLETLKRRAEAYERPTVVMIFEPQPQEFFHENQAPARLMSLRDKYQALRQFGIDYLLCLPFNARFAQWTAQQFIADLLIEKLQIRHLIVGDDFRFGRGREGDLAALTTASAVHGFHVEDTTTYQMDQHRVSSSVIRSLLQQGLIKQAESLLGHPWVVSGKVQYGQQLGRSLGFPTANIGIHQRSIPVHGVFAVTLKNTDGQVLCGVANIGARPTVQGKGQQLEVHIFDFDQSIYGQRIEVTMIKKLRDEQQFESLSMLKQQIELDVGHARSILKAHFKE
jgi:riboflavin kinase/FMN adenylyltransferase